MFDLSLLVQLYIRNFMASTLDLLQEGYQNFSGPDVLYICHIAGKKFSMANIRSLEDLASIDAHKIDMIAVRNPS